MHAETLRIAIQIVPGFRSKKRTLRSIVEKLHRHFNVAVVSESSRPPADYVLGVATVAAGRRETLDVLDRVIDALSAHPRVVIQEVARFDP